MRPVMWQVEIFHISPVMKVLLKQEENSSALCWFGHKPIIKKNVPYDEAEWMFHK